MKTAIILGSNSDIAKGLTPLLTADGWEVVGWDRTKVLEPQPWDLVLCALGAVGPVGLWHDLYEFDIHKNMLSNLTLPIKLLRALWPLHNPGASVCFLAGSNPNAIMKGYFAYNVAKMALLKAVEQMDAETPDAKFFALGPGTILTKIHRATVDAGWNNPKLKKALDDHRDYAHQNDVVGKIQRVYECLKWCMQMPKDIVGGRNICASDPWDEPGSSFAAWLEMHQNGAKLRRQECGH